MFLFYDGLFIHFEGHGVRLCVITLYANARRLRRSVFKFFFVYRHFDRKGHIQICSFSMLFGLFSLCDWLWRKAKQLSFIGFVKFTNERLKVIIALIHSQLVF